MRKDLKPECKYYVDYSVTMEDVEFAYCHNETLTGYVIRNDRENKELIVVLGDNVLGRLPWSEVTIKALSTKYPQKRDVPDQIAFLAAKNIRVKVTKITEDGIMLSRKANMLEAWNEISKRPKDFIYTSAFLNANSAGTMLFYDIGDGIVAACNLYEFTNSRVEVNEWLSYGEVHKMVILKKNPENYVIEVSRKQACQKNYKDFKPLDIVDVKIGKPVKDDANKIEGYRVEVTPLVDGIALLPYDGPKRFRYGKIVKACVRKVKPSRPEGGPTINLQIL